MPSERNALFLGVFEDKEYIPLLKQMFGGMKVFVLTEPISLLMQLEIYCTRNSITSVVTTSPKILEALLNLQNTSAPISPSIDNYAGSLFSHKNLEILFINPLKQLVTVNYGKFITARHISKIVSPEKWGEATPFSFTVADSPIKLQEAYDLLSQAYAIGEDIETTKDHLLIRCISFTGVFINPDNSIHTHSYVIPLASAYNLTWVRKINQLEAQKIFQNGKYDNAYLLRYNAVPNNWLWDTAHLSHCYYSELPKDLGYLNAFYLRKVIYWKDLAQTIDLYEYYKYNALDSWATVNVWIRQMLEMPDWAKHNYFLEFPLVYPCLLSEMTGLVRDGPRLEAARSECDAEVESSLASLQKMTRTPINPRSHVQVKSLLKTLTGKDWDSSDEKNLEKAAYAHPLNRIIINKILKVRELQKRKSTYLRTDADIKRNKDGSPAASARGSKDYKSFWLYSLNPHHTDTGRLASGEHQFWCGANIQNVPTGREVKQTITTFTGFRLAECDLKQAESRDTAYIAGSEPLIAAVTGSKDFHSVNASAFFGASYDSIFDDAIGKTKNKLLRDLAKRTNHGANYNMGPGMLVDTMGEENIWNAAAILGLKGYSAIGVGDFLLAKFHATYPELKGSYYKSVIYEITTTRKLVSRAFHHLDNIEYSSKDIAKYIGKGDWTRYCFGHPDKNKLDLNSYVAHCPQSLNARTLNEAYMRVFYKIALKEKEDFRLHAQGHDSILFSFREGRTDLIERVKECMEIPVSVKGTDGKIRTFTVPADIKAGPLGTGVKYWSDTE